MMKYLNFYILTINGTPISELDTYMEKDVNDKDIVIITDEIINNEQYINQTDNAIILCHKLGDEIFKNYQEKQEHIKIFGYQKSWENLTNDEKDIIIDYYANPPIDSEQTQITQIITHLMEKNNLSYDDALEIYIDKWHNHWSNYLDDCAKTWRDTVKIVVKYLSLVDSADLFDIVSPLVDFYLSTGRLGLGFGDSKDGLINYIRSDYGFTKTGLEYNNYDLRKGTWVEFIEALTLSLAGKHYKRILMYKDLLNN